ncbi:MAG: hypothetical protein A2V66_10175 [Ignavibacteria bacterium RBG_13_36_8]|nr:MAG: hypothetical protein A2V66_10175 [Ignavibacteria bacterium RBG_13_36_8]
MINPNDFYSKDEIPGFNRRQKMWRGISKSIKREKEKFLRRLEFRSFILGIAASGIAFFTIIGVYTSVKNLSETKLPDQIKINNAYRNAINDFEKALPVAVNNGDRSVQVDDWISSRKEQMENLNNAIYELSTESQIRDFSPLKQQRLWELYRLKLKILDEMIELEGRKYEDIN